MSVKILILGNINSTFILNYVKELKAKMNCEVDIFTEPIRPQQKGYVKKFINYFDNIYEISKYNNRIINRIPKIRGILQIKNIANQIDNLGIYDICHIHYLENIYGFIASQIVKKSKKLVISVWGSDLYRTNWRQKMGQYNIIKYANRITFNTKQTSEEFSKYFKNIDKDKLKIKKFGSTPLGILRNIEHISKKDCKKSFDISTNSLVVTCGNNASQGNEHIKIIKSIEIVKHKLPDNILFLFPFTYGFVRKYFLKVKGLLDKSNLNYRVLTDFLSDYEVAQLRKASDIMINLPISDQLSGSMQESLYTGNIVITGDWLPYKILEEKGIFMLKVPSVGEVGEKLLYSVNNLRNLKESCKGNSQIIWNISSWDKNINDWIQMYKELLQS
jgi:glycosyltransferase involved in cell wall biosynthesis